MLGAIRYCWNLKGRVSEIISFELYLLCSNVLTVPKGLTFSRTRWAYQHHQWRWERRI